MRRVACSSLGEPTYGTFAALFRDAYRVDEGDSLEVAQHKLQLGMRALGADAQEADSVGQVLGYLLGIQEARPRDIEPEQLQRQITLAAYALIERRLAQQPLVIVVDDLHWADSASVDLLCDVVDQFADRPLLLLVSHRADARALRPLRAMHSMVELGPLDEADASALVDRLLDTSAIEAMATVRNLIAARAGGNPLFVEEIVRSLVGAGMLRARTRPLGLRAGLHCDGRATHAVRPAAVPCRPARCRRSPGAAGSGCAWRRVRQRAAAPCGQRSALD